MPGARPESNGPVCAVTGVHDYEPIVARFRVPVVVTGPEAVDLLDAILRAVGQLERGTEALSSDGVVIHDQGTDRHRSP